MSQKSGVRVREIRDADLADIAEILAEGFPAVSRGSWRLGLEHMRERFSPPGYPRYGYMLEFLERPVGVLLTIFSYTGGTEKQKIRCNTSSWYVQKPFRIYGTSMVRRLFKYPELTIINVSPAIFTWPTITANGYRRFSEGQIVCAPALKFGTRHPHVRPYRPQDAARMRDTSEAAMMSYHAERGCLTLTCDTGADLIPLIFVIRAIRRLWPRYAQLFYCRDTADFVGNADAVGRWLLFHGFGFVTLDANGPIKGLNGLYLPNRQPKYFRGPDAPRLNDLSFTETAILGV